MSLGPLARQLVRAWGENRLALAPPSCLAPPIPPPFTHPHPPPRQVKADQVETSTLVSCVGSSNDIGKVISEYAAEAKADSVVVGARGLGAFKR